MDRDPIGIIVNGATGRMGYHQHLFRSLIPIRDAGGVQLSDGTRQPIRLMLAGRRPEALAEIANRLGVADWTTDLDAALGDPRWTVYMDAAATSTRADNLRKAIAAGKAIYTEKPIAATLQEAKEVAHAARAAGVLTGVVHDKLYLPGFRKLRRLIDSGFFGRILSVRGEFGYWVWEGDWQPAQRPSWNYRKADGGGIVSDMFPHWDYLIENLFGHIHAVTARAVTHIDQRWDEHGQPYQVTADDSAYAILEVGNGTVVSMNSSWDVRVHRRELLEFQVDGTRGSAVVGLWGVQIQPRELTPRPVWNPDVPDRHDYLADWAEVPDNIVDDSGDWQNAFKVQWEEFLRALAEHQPYSFDLMDGVRGLRLAEAAQRSSDEGRRVVLEPVTDEHSESEAER